MSFILYHINLKSVPFLFDSNFEIKTRYRKQNIFIFNTLVFQHNILPLLTETFNTPAYSLSLTDLNKTYHELY